MPNTSSTGDTTTVATASELKQWTCSILTRIPHVSESKINLDNGMRTTRFALLIQAPLLYSLTLAIPHKHELESTENDHEAASVEEGN